MRLRIFTMLLVLLSLSGFVMSALADDLTPPPWRGQPGTTFAQWEFLTPDPNPLPDLFFNPYGMPEMHVYPGVGQQWMPIWGDRAGVWPLSGAIEILIPNQPIPNPYKEIWLQITWASQAPDTAPIVSEPMHNGSVQLVNTMPVGPTNEPFPAGANWYHSLFKIRIEPNPPIELIRIDGAVMVDEIVVDTICVPEPSSIAVFGTMLVGIAGTLLRKK